MWAGLGVVSKYLNLQCMQKQGFWAVILLTFGVQVSPMNIQISHAKEALSLILNLKTPP